MKIIIDDRLVEIPDEVIEKAFEDSIKMILGRYMTIELTTRLGIKTLLRTVVFPAIETSLHIPMRPDRSTDPLEFVLQTFSTMIQEVIKHATTSINTSLNADRKTHRVTDCSLAIENTSQGGRQLVIDWSEGERKDDLRDTTTPPSD